MCSCFFLYTYMSQLAICDACVLHAQLSSGIKVHVFMCMFCTRIFQMLVFNARVVVFVLQCKSVIRDHTLMCIFCIRISELRVCDVLWNNIGNDVCMCTGVASATQWARM